MRQGVRTGALILIGGASLAACDVQGGDPVQRALRDAAAARQTAALKTTDEAEAQAARRAASVPSADAGDDLSSLIAARRRAVEATRALIAATDDPVLKAQLTGDLAAEEGRLRALEARQAPR